MGDTVSTTATRSTPYPNDTFMDDLLQFSFAEFLLSDEMFRLNSGYLSFISSIRILSSCLSVPCILYNVMLLVVLLLDEDFCSWQFFPMMLQCGMDAIGPGIANIVYNYQLKSKAVTMNDLPKEFMVLEKKGAIETYLLFWALRWI